MSRQRLFIHFVFYASVILDLFSYLGALIFKGRKANCNCKRDSNGLDKKLPESVKYAKEVQSSVCAQTL